MEDEFCFGEFAFDAGSGELRRLDGSSAAQRLPPQPARLLGLLAERQGGVVSRDEIRDRLWPDTHVDFDASLHFCVRQVRAALGDSAAEPRYVENVPRRGYRLLPEVSRGAAGIEAPPPAVRSTRRAAWFIAVSAIVAVVALGYYIVEQRAAPASPVRIGLMPFQPPAGFPGSEGWRPVAEWILEDLAAASPTLQIVGPTTTAAYADSDAGLRRLADEFDLQYILNGRYLDDDKGLRMLAELIRVSDGAHLWVRSYDDAGGGQRVGLEISRNVARVLTPEDDPGERRNSK